MLDAELELVSARRGRRIPYDQFATGYRRTVLEPDELLAAVWIRPRRDRAARMYYRKVAARAAQGLSKLVFAAVAELHEGRHRNVRLAFGCAGPTTLRARSAEQRAEGEPPSSSLGRAVAELLPRDLAPIDDARSTADYRLRVARNLVCEFLAGHLGVIHRVA